MKTIELEELRRIQLDIVQALHDFCLANNIKYSLSCGSLLGAIRHGGYIPWDDDIDVYMERDDYNRFISIFPKSYQEVYEFSCLETDKKWHIPYGKLFDNRTVLYENGPDWIPIGVNIDVFPVDCAPIDVNEFKKYNKKRSLIRDIIHYKNLKFRRDYSFIKNISILLVRVYLFFFGRRFHARIVSRYAQRYNRSNKVCGFFENVMGTISKRPFDKTDFSETILHEFEDRKLCVMKGYDHCLRCTYGDYMQLPPIEKRVSHHSFKAYWKE